MGCAKGNDAYEWSPSVSRSTDPNKRRRWLVIPIILAQIALKIFVIDRLLEDDGAVGDQYGPFEPETIAENRDVLRRRKVRSAGLPAAWPVILRDQSLPEQSSSNLYRQGFHVLPLLLSRHTYRHFSTRW